MGKGIKIKGPKIKLPKIKIGKDLGLKAVGKAVGNVGSAVTKAVKDTGTGVSKGTGDIVSQVGRTIKDKGTIEAGKNITRESKKGFEQYAPLLTQIAGNALTMGGYGAVNSLANMAQSGKFDLGQAASAVGSVAGFNPAMMQAIQGGSALAKGDLKGAALASLGSLGSSGGQNFLSNLTKNSGTGSLTSALTNPNVLKFASSALSGDKGGIARGLAGYSGLGDSTSNLVGSLVGGDKKGIAQGLAGAAGLSPQLTQALTGAASGDTTSALLGLAGASGTIDPKRLSAIEALSKGKLSAENARNALGGILPEMSTGGNGDSEPGFLKSIQNLGSGFSTGDYTPDALKGMSTSGILPSISNPLSNFSLDQEAGGKGSENWAAIKNAASGIFGGDKFQASRAPAGEEIPEDQVQQNEPGFFEQATDAVGNFVGGAKPAIGAGIQGTAAYLQQQEYERRWKERQKLQKQQLEDLKGAGSAYQAMKYDPTRYEEYSKFLSDRIAGKGIGAQEKKMQQEGDIRAGRSAAGQRTAALEQMAQTMGRGATGSGSALAAALSGGQSAMDIQSQTNLAREASAQANLERSLAAKSGLSTQATKEEADLAQQQSDYRLRQLSNMGLSRNQLDYLQNEMAGTTGRGIQAAADLATGALASYESPEERQKRLRNQALADQQEQQRVAASEEMRQAELDKKRAETEALRRPSSQPTEIPPTQQTTPQVQPTKPSQSATPKPTTPKPVPPPAGPSQSQINQALNRGSYTIQKGDTLGKRYKDLGYGSWQEAYEANKDLVGDNPNLIKTGQTLRRKDEMQDKRMSTPVQNMNKKYSGSNIA